MGACIGQNNATELPLVGLGFCATILRFAEYPLAPLLIGFILGRMPGDDFARSMQLHDRVDFAAAWPASLERPAPAAFAIMLPGLRGRRAQRDGR